MQNFFKLKIILTYIFLLQVSTQLTIQNDIYFIVCIEALNDEAWNFLFCRCNKKKLAMKERYSTQHNSDSVAFSNEEKTFLLPISKDYIEDMDMSLSLSASLA